MVVSADAPTLDEAYARCRAFTKARATSFYYAFTSLPKKKRQAIHATYAFAGTVDDIVDNAGSDGGRQRALAEARMLLDSAYAGAGDDWLPMALGDAVQRYDIPREHFLELIAGMEQDIKQTRYGTYAELEEYCYRAASTIGLICIEIFGYDRSRRELAVEEAVAMGKALQITNIMRDIKEDAERDRIYVAQEDLEAHGYSEADLMTSVYNDSFRALMADYAQRARELYEGGERLIPRLDGARSRMCCNGLQGVYRGLLNEIIRRDYDVYSDRVSPSKTRRVLLLGRLWISAAWPQRNPR